MLVERKGGMRQPAVTNLDQEPSTSELELQVRLAGGLGVSVINTVPEELVYGTLDQIEVCEFPWNIPSIKVLFYRTLNHIGVGIFPWNIT